MYPAFMLHQLLQHFTLEDCMYLTIMTKSVGCLYTREAKITHTHKHLGLSPYVLQPRTEEQMPKLATRKVT